MFCDLYKKKRKARESFEAALRLQGFLKTLPFNNLETIKDFKTERAIEFDVIKRRLLVKSMHKKVIKGTDSGCLDNQYR